MRKVTVDWLSWTYIWLWYGIWTDLGPLYPLLPTRELCSYSKGHKTRSPPELGFLLTTLWKMQLSWLVTMETPAYSQHSQKKTGIHPFRELLREFDAKDFLAFFKTNKQKTPKKTKRRKWKNEYWAVNMEWVWKIPGWEIAIQCCWGEQGKK